MELNNDEKQLIARLLATHADGSTEAERLREKLGGGRVEYGDGTDFANVADAVDYPLRHEYRTPRALLGRLIDELHTADVLSLDAVGRVIDCPLYYSVGELSHTPSPQQPSMLNASNSPAASLALGESLLQGVADRNPDDYGAKLRPVIEALQNARKGAGSV